jgi:hypothetical protein
MSIKPKAVLALMEKYYSIDERRSMYGKFSLSQLVNALFGEETKKFSHTYRRNTEESFFVPVLSSTPISGVGIYSYVYNHKCWRGHIHAETVGVGFDLYTLEGTKEWVRFDRPLPLKRLNNLTEITDHWELQVGLFENLHELISSVEGSKEHLIRAYGLTTVRG